MLFNSLQYAVFLPIVFALYWALPHKYRQPVLLIASYYFYMSWNVKYVVLILFTTAVSYTAAVLLERTDRAGKRKLLLAATLVACLGVLFLFKYFNFFMGSLAAAAQRFAIPLHPTTLKLLLPVGISFYTFQTLSYVIDVYRGDVTAEKNFFTYALFVSFFPQLVAGPIERTKNLLPQLKAEHTFDYDQAMYGLKLIAWGYFKKLVVADNFAVYVDEIYQNIFSHQGFVLILAAFSFMIQIYCDFSGYSDIARGTAKLFGIDLMVNFKGAYLSASVREFWSRNHISLSRWFRDYVYIPLGGNRGGRLKKSINMLLTFTLSGLWHGASWTFVIWGAVHGIAQIIEDALGISKAEKVGSSKWFIRVSFMLCFSAMSLVFFRAQTLGEAVYVFRHMFDGVFSPIHYLHQGFADFSMTQTALLCSVLFYILPLVVYDYIDIQGDAIIWLNKRNRHIETFFYIGVIMLIIFLFPTTKTEFIYFHF